MMSSSVMPSGCVDIAERQARPRRGVLAAVVLGLAVAAPGIATAQVEPCEPYYVTVKKEGAPLKCRDGTPYYPVKNLAVGDVLRVDGQSPAWVRVEYPAGLPAFAKPEWVQVEPDGKTLKLTKPTRLMAANVEVSQAGNWWYLLDTDLPAGTVFAVTKSLKGPDGKEYGYLVPAPKQARGYVKKEFVEKSTPAEIETFQKAQGTPAESADAEKPPAVGAAPTTPSGTAPPPPPPSPSPTAAQPSEAAPEQPGAPAPAVITTAAPVPQPAAPATNPNRPLAKVEALASLYEEATKKPMEQAELEAAVAEFQRTIDSLGNTPEDEAVRKHLTPYMQVLKMRSDIQAKTRMAATANDAVRQQSLQVAEQIAKLERMRQYDVAGRLVASTVYDGKRLPLMYRVLSAEPTTARTLAYVAPGAGLNLGDKVGRVVGVVGDSRFDESLRVNIIVPTRVDVLTAAGTVETVAPPAGAAAAPPAGASADVNK
jgi:hypothetical protein